MRRREQHTSQQSVAIAKNIARAATQHRYPHGHVRDRHGFTVLPERLLTFEHVLHEENARRLRSVHTQAEMGGETRGLEKPLKGGG